MTDVYILIRQEEYEQLVKGGNEGSTLMEPATLYHSNQGGLSKEQPPSSNEYTTEKQVGRGEIKSTKTIKQSDDNFSSGDESEQGSSVSSIESVQSQSSEDSDFEERENNWFECWEGIHFKE